MEEIPMNKEQIVRDAFDKYIMDMFSKYGDDLDMRKAITRMRDTGYEMFKAGYIALVSEQKPSVPEVEAKYSELLMAVARKFPNETRHETALKYIKQMEEPSKSAAQLAAARGE
jgi:Lon protease-like protein